METIITAIIVIYCIIVLFIMIEKKIDAMPHPQSKELTKDDEWIDVAEEEHKFLNFAIDLSDTPACETPCRPIKK